tara:strand:- start:39 stop:3482 length:3444 start_codon:yes stop_codon:yes gene_type:complete
MGYKKTLTPGAIEIDQGTLSDTKEDIRLDQIIPSEILENKEKLDQFLQAYYTFMNMDEFIFQETNTFTDIVLNGQAQYRISDPNNENNKFFTDESGASSTLKLTSPTGTTTDITLNDINVAITNGNELPGSLAKSTSEIGKTFTVTGLEAFNGHTAVLTTIQKNWVGPGPSYVMNTIESAMDIDTNDEGYLELMQKEIAATIPRGVTVDKRTLYKQIIDFYRLRGTTDSIEIFFKILFNDFAEIEFPFDKVLIPSSGNWDINPSLSRGGQYLDNKGFLSDSIKIHDSLKFQKFSYLIKTGKNISDWDLSFDRLVHPAGFIYFAEILIFLQLTKDILGDDVFNSADYIDFNPDGTRSGRIRTDELGLSFRKVLSALPKRQPGIIGPEDIPVLIEMFVSSFLPQTQVNIHKSGTISLELKNGIINTITITNAGSGYLTAPTTANNKITTSDSSAAGGHTKATITTTLTNGSVGSPTIVEGGRNYGQPVITFAAPAPMTFDGSDDEVGGTGIVNISDNTIKLTSAQQAALPVNAIVTYATTGGAIGGLVSGQQYKIHTSSGNKVKLKSLTGSSVINLSGVGTGTNHTFTGVTATATATVLDGSLKSVSIVEPGFGYASAPAISFNGIAIDGLTGVAPSVTIGIDSNGRLDLDNITINSEGSNWSNLFGSVAANPNVNKVAKITTTGLANKKFRTPPLLTVSPPTAVDVDGNLLSTNVNATAKFNLEPTSVSHIDMINGGSSYTSQPTITFSNPETNYTATPFFTEDYENTTVGSAGFGANPWKIIDNDGNPGGTHHTSSIVTEGGSKVLKIQTSSLDTNANGQVGGVVYELSLESPNFVNRINGNTIKIKCKAKKASSNGASFFEMAYSTSQFGNSGFQRKTLTTSFQEFEFEYDVSASTPTNKDYLGFQGDGNNGIVFIDDVSITVKHDNPRAEALIESGKITSINLSHLGSGYTSNPTITIAGGGGTGASAISILVPSKISNTTITNVGNGYVIDPTLSFNSGANNELRVPALKHNTEISCNHNDVAQTTGTAINPKQSTGSQDGRTLFNGGLLKIGTLASGDNFTITQSSSSADKFLPEHTVKVKNDNFRTIINNNYIQRKGTDNFFNTPRLFNTNRTIESLSNKTLQTIDSSDINNNNTSTFVHIE